jgi:hypothetical protein
VDVGLVEVDGAVDDDSVGHGGNEDVVVGEFDVVVLDDEDERELSPGRLLSGGGVLGPDEGGTGGGGTEAGGGAAAAFGAPIGILLSGVGSTPVR